MSAADRPYGTARVSAPRRRIADEVASMRGAFAVEDLVTALADAGRAVGLATVYRALSAMERAGSVARVGERGGAALFARCATGGHHHHLVCTDCGHVAHTACPLDEPVLRAASDAGFMITGHEIVLYGVCAACRGRGAKGPALATGGGAAGGP